MSIDQNVDGCQIILLEKTPVIGQKLEGIIWKKNYANLNNSILIDTIPIPLANHKIYYIIFWSYVNTKMINGSWQKSAYSMEWTIFTIDTTKKTASSLELFQNYPNPFNNETIISWSQQNGGHITIAIYDLIGREVKKIVDDKISAGNHFSMWNGTNDAGQTVASGVYFLYAKTPKTKNVIKMIFLR